MRGRRHMYNSEGSVMSYLSYDIVKHICNRRLQRCRHALIRRLRNSRQSGRLCQGKPMLNRSLVGDMETPATPFASGVIDEMPRTGGSNVTIDLVDPVSPSLTRWQLPTGEFRSTSSPVSANPHDVETRKKKMLEHLSLGKFEEVPCDLPTPPFAGP